MKFIAVLSLILAFSFICFQGVNAQNVGINTPTPEAALDINGDMITRASELIVADGITLSLDVNTARFSYYRITGPVADFTIAGIAAGIDGRQITLFNRSGFTMQINNEDAGAAATNLIVTGTGVDISIVNKSVVNLQYDGAEQKWIVKSSSRAGTGSGYWDLSGSNIFNNTGGNVGIGTSNPAERLTIQTSTASYGFTHTDGNIRLSSYLGTGGAWMGTQSNHPLSIYTNNGNAQVTFRTDFTTDFGGSNTQIRLFDGASNSGHIKAIGNNLEISARKGNFSQGHLALQIDDDQLPAGNVGIGTITPPEKLTVQTLNNSYGISHRGEGGNFLATRIGGSSAGIGTFSNTHMRIFCNNATAIFIAAPSGNVGIGVSDDPQAKLHVNKDAEALRLSGSGTYMSFYNSTNYRGYLWSKEPADIELGTAVGNTTGNVNLGVQGTPQLVVQSDGRVRVGTLGCTFPMVNGGGASLPKFSTFGSIGIKSDDGDFVAEWAFRNLIQLQLYFNGGIRAFVDETDGEWISVSDQRLKDDFIPYRSVIEGIKKIEVQTFHYKNGKSGTRSFGLVAQNVQQYFPEIVADTGDKEKLLGIAYAKTGVLAIKAIQEQQEIIEAQQKKIESLERRLAALENRLK